MTDAAAMDESAGTGEWVLLSYRLPRAPVDAELFRVIGGGWQ